MAEEAAAAAKSVAVAATEVAKVSQEMMNMNIEGFVLSLKVVSCFSDGMVLFPSFSALSSLLFLF